MSIFHAGISKQLKALLSPRIARVASVSSLTYIGSFGAAKLLAYVIPLILAVLMPSADYVAVEYALTIGSIGGMLLGLGLPSAIPQFALYMRPPVPLTDLAGLQAATLGGGMAVLGFIGAILGVSLHWTLIPLMICTYIFQYAGYQYALTKTQPSVAVWISNLTLMIVFFSIGAGWVVATVAGTSLMFAATIFLGALTLIAAGVVGASAWRSLAPQPLKRLRQALSFGVPVAFNGMVATWSVSAIRVYAEWELPKGQAAALLFDFRLASILITAHVLISTAVFKQLYVIEAKRLDRLLSVYAIAAMFVVLFFNFAMDFGPVQRLLEAVGERSTGFACFVTLFVFLWSITAFVDVLINRSGKAMRAALCNGAGAAGFAFLVKSGLIDFSGNSLALLCCAQLAVVILIQTLCLPQSERPWRTASIAIGTTMAGFVILSVGAQGA